LEELGLPYNFTRIGISKNTQKEPWFLKINRTYNLFSLKKKVAKYPQPMGVLPP
jgi:hypothetical protein